MSDGPLVLHLTARPDGAAPSAQLRLDLSYTIATIARSVDYVLRNGGRVPVVDRAGALHSLDPQDYRFILVAREADEEGQG
jgi:hypothetical protein